MGWRGNFHALFFLLGRPLRLLCPLNYQLLSSPFCKTIKHFVVARPLLHSLLLRVMRIGKKNFIFIFSASPKERDKVGWFRQMGARQTQGAIFEGGANENLFHPISGPRPQHTGSIIICRECQSNSGHMRQQGQGPSLFTGKRKKRFLVLFCFFSVVLRPFSSSFSSPAHFTRYK